MRVLVNYFHFSPKMRNQPICVCGHFCVGLATFICAATPYLSFTQARHLKGACSPFKLSFVWILKNCQHFPMQRSMLPIPKDSKRFLKSLPKKTLARDSLDTAVGGGWCVGHHLALARDVVVAGERWVVVRHQAVLGGHVLGGVRAVWLGMVTLGRKCLFLMIELVTFYLGWNHGSLEVGRLIFRQCRFSPGFSSSY